MTTDFAEVTPNRAKQLIRFGWALAELRGRLYFGDADPGRLQDPKSVKRTWHALPLGEERSSPELRIAVLQQVGQFAADVALLGDGKSMADADGKRPEVAVHAVDRVIQLAAAVPAKNGTEEWAKSWNAFAEALYEWDAQIQDELAWAPFGESSAYQLGRGLSETSWSLDPSAPSTSAMSWQFLVGVERSIALTSLVTRLTPSVIPVPVAQCIKGSLARWTERVTSSGFESDVQVTVNLRRQIALWRDLLLCNTDPQALVPPLAPLRRISVLVPALMANWPQTIAGFVSTALLGGAAYLFTTSHPSGLWTTLVTVLGVLGVTGATVSAKASAAASKFAISLRAAVSADQLVAAATLLPPSKGRTRPHRTRMPGSFAAPLTVDAASTSLLARPLLPSAPLATGS